MSEIVKQTSISTLEKIENSSKINAQFAQMKMKSVALI